MTDAVRVLIAEDDALVCEMIQGLLERLGYKVVGMAENGEEAVELAHVLHPDVALMDIHMPVMDGIAAAERIREQCPLPVVMLTAYEGGDLVQRASAAGVGAYLVKPPNARDLERTITIAMARFADLMNLKRLNEELDAYAHTVAHDLKNPLSTLVGFAEVLADEGTTMSGDRLQHYLQLVAQSGYKMINIIDELLLLASVRKRSDVPLEPMAMGPVVTTAQRRLTDMLGSSGTAVAAPESWPITLGYAPWIEEVWVNYISNALKYGGQPPQVLLGYDLQTPTPEQPETPAVWGGSPAKPPRDTQTMVRFWVADNGPGISEEAQSHLFVPFDRPTQQTRATGHGLGLSIVRRIVERLGGQVGVESPSPLASGSNGPGSLFWFTLPLADIGD